MPKLLLVEDNEYNRDMLMRRLAKKGFKVVVAVDGGEGVAKARSEKPDLILMDMHLPVLDGSDLAGLVSIGDVVKHLAGERERTIQELTTYIQRGYA